jgi:hypothetical protein
MGTAPRRRLGINAKSLKDAYGSLSIISTIDDSPFTFAQLG